MNAITRLSESSSAVVIGTVIPFHSPVHEPEVIAANEAASAPMVPTGPATALADRAALTRALDIVSSVIERRNTIPILSNVLLEARDGKLHITGTDLDIEISVSMAAAVDPHFGLTLPAHTMRDLLKKATASEFVGFLMPEMETCMQKVSVWQDGKHMTEEIEAQRYTSPAAVDFERVKYKLEALPVCDFPSLQPGNPSHSFTVSGAGLVDAFGGVAMAISTEETRYYLNGVYLHHVEPRAIDAYHGDRGALRFVATDGHRLCRQDLAAVEGCEGMPGIIIPRKTVSLLQKLLKKGKASPESVKVEASTTKIRLSFGDVTVTSKLVDGTFPDYQRVIPTGNDKDAAFNSAELSEAVRAVTVISSERGRAVKLTFSNGKCELAVNNPDQGSATADLEIGYDADPLEIGFNAKYLQDFIATADSEEITLTMSDAGAPTLIRGSNRDGWLGALMPMRV